MKVIYKTATLQLTRALLLLLLLVSVVPYGAQAQPSKGAAPTSNGDPRDQNPRTQKDQRELYGERMRNAKNFFPTNMGGSDVLVPIGNSKNGKGPKKSDGPGTVIHSKSGPVFVWPVLVPTSVSKVPTKRDEAIQKNLFNTFGYPVSDTQFQIIDRYNDNIMLEQMFDPEKVMWMATTIGGIEANSAANSAGNMAVNQSISAIDFTKKYLVNFTAQAGNVWHRIRDQLFIPMAILLLLPGAVLAQVKAIVAQGSPVWAGESSPLEGITRSIVSVFLIPGTFLVINYGIDVSNSITFTIADEYKRIFGTDMYEDAICAEKRAFPVNPKDRNENAIHTKEQTMPGKGTTVWNAYEALNLNLREYDPCVNLDNTRYADEEVKQAKNIGRAATNFSNTGLTGAWNVMCAFQMAYLYYLWCMGPIAAALWVWPIAPLRNALKSWIEGVVTLCFWSLFWNTVVLLMACFKGVGDNGAVIMTALNFLANACVKKAFDFAGLVAEGGAAAAQEAMKNANDAASGGGKGSPGQSGAGATPTGRDGQTGTGAPGTGAPGSGSTTSATGVPMTGSDGRLLGTGAGTETPAFKLGADGNPLNADGTGMRPNGDGTFTSSDGTKVGADGRAIGGPDPGLPPTSEIGQPGGAGSKTENAALAALGRAGGAPPLESDKRAFENLKARDDKGDPSATATLQALAKTKPEDLEKARQGDQAAQKAIEEKTGMDWKALDGALKQDQPSMMTALAVQGSGGADVMKAAAGGDASARAQIEARTGCSADQVLRAAGYGEGGPSRADQMGVMATAGLNQKVQDAARMGDPGAQQACDAARAMFARDQQTGEVKPIGQYNEQTGQWTAGDGKLTYDPQSGSYRTADGGAVTYDANSGQWYANGTQGQVAYDLKDGRFEAANSNNAVTYDQNTGRWTAADTNGAVALNPTSNRFEAVNSDGAFSGKAAISDPSGNGQWYQVAQNGDVMAYSPQGPSSIPGPNGEQIPNPNSGPNGGGSWVQAGNNAPIEVKDGQVFAKDTGGNIMYDQSQGRFEAVTRDPQTGQITGTVDTGLTYNKDNNTWYAQGTNNSVAYDTQDKRFEAMVPQQGGGTASTNEAVSYNNGQWQVDSTKGQVVFDQGQGRFETASGNAVSYNAQAAGGGTWQSSDGRVTFDKQDMRFERSDNGQVAVADPRGNGQWYAASADASGGVQVLPASGGNWQAAGADSSVQYQNGQFIAQGSNGDVRYDAKDGRWEYKDTNVALSRDGVSQQWYAQGTGGQVVYDPNLNEGPGKGRLEVAGTNQAVYRDAATQQFTAAGTNGSVVLDQSQPGGARWEVRGTDTGLIADSRTGNWVAEGSSGKVIWDASQNRLETTLPGRGEVPVVPDPSGRGYYAVASNGSMSVLDQGGNWRAAPPDALPIRMDQQTGAVYAEGTGGRVQFDRQDNRWEIAGSNQAVSYEQNSGLWVAPNTNNRIAYDPLDRRMEVVGTNTPVVSSPQGGGGGYYTVTAQGQVQQYDTSSGQFRQAGNDAPIQYDASRNALVASGSNGTVTYDPRDGRWEAREQPVTYNPSNGQYYVDGTNRQIAYDPGSQMFRQAETGTAVSYNQNTGGWNIAGTDTPVRTADGGFRDPNGSLQPYVAPGTYASAAGYAAANYSQQQQREGVYAPQQREGGYAPQQREGYYTPGSAQQGYTSTSGTYSRDAGITYDRQDQRYEIQGTNQPVSYDTNSGRWVAPDSQGRIAYDPVDKRLEVMGTNQQVVAGPQGGYYSVSSSGQVQQFDASNGSFRAVGNDAPVQYNPETRTLSASGTSGSVVYDQKQGRWEANNVPVSYSRDSSSWYVDGSNSKIAYDSGSQSFRMAETGQQVQYNANQGNWTYSGSDTPVRIEGGYQTATNYTQGSGQVYYDAPAGGSATQYTQAYTGSPQGYTQGYTQQGYTESQGYTTQQGYTTGSPPGSAQGYAGGAITYDRQDQRWEIAGTNQQVNYDNNSGRWITSDSQGRVAYDPQDKRLEVVGTNQQVVSAPQGGGSYYTVSSSGQVQQLDLSSGSFKPAGTDAPVQYNPETRMLSASGTNGSVVYDQQQGRWEAGNVPVTYSKEATASGGWYVDGSNNQIAYDSSSQTFRMAENGQQVQYDANRGGWNYAGTDRPAPIQGVPGGAEGRIAHHSSWEPQPRQDAGQARMATDWGGGAGHTQHHQTAHHEPHYVEPQRYEPQHYTADAGHRYVEPAQNWFHDDHPQHHGGHHHQPDGSTYVADQQRHDPYQQPQAPQRPVQGSLPGNVEKRNIAGIINTGLGIAGGVLGFRRLAGPNQGQQAPRQNRGPDQVAKTPQPQQKRMTGSLADKLAPRQDNMGQGGKKKKKRDDNETV